MKIFLAGHAGFADSKTSVLKRWTDGAIRAGLAKRTMFSFHDIKINQRGDHSRFRFMAKKKRKK